jgi:hypothetical protein
MRGVIRTAFERENLVAACKASGLSPKVFAEREHIPTSTLYQWLAKHPSPERAPRIARVVRRAPAHEANAPTPASPPLSWLVEVGAARIRVSTGFDRSLLAELLGVLESRCCKEPS